MASARREADGVVAFASPLGSACVLRAPRAAPPARTDTYLPRRRTAARARVGQPPPVPTRAFQCTTSDMNTGRSKVSETSIGGNGFGLTVREGWCPDYGNSYVAGLAPLDRVSGWSTATNEQGCPPTAHVQVFLMGNAAGSALVSTVHAVDVPTLHETMRAALPSSAVTSHATSTLRCTPSRTAPAEVTMP